MRSLFSLCFSALTLFLARSPMAAQEADAPPASGQAASTAAPVQLPPFISGTGSFADLSPLHTETDFTEQEILLQGLDDLSDLSVRAPNFFMVDSGNRGFGNIVTMRGVGNTPFFSDPGVGLYVDGVPFGSVASYSPNLINVDEINVFRGPQFTLFGRNTPGGVIDIKTPRPTNQHEGGITLSYGTYDRRLGDFSARGPIREGDIFYTFDAFYEEREGFVENEFLGTEVDDREAKGLRLGLTYLPTDRFEITLGGELSLIDDGGQPMTALGSPDHFEVMSETEGRTEIDRDSQWLKLAAETEIGTFTSVTARRNWRMEPNLLDLDLAPPFMPGARLVSEVNLEQEIWTEELHWESPDNGGDWAFRGGLFLLNGDNEGRAPRLLFSPGPFPPAGPYTENTVWEIEEQSVGVFGSATYSVNERLDVTGGLRFDHVEKEIQRFRTSPIAPGTVDDDGGWSYVSPTLGAVYIVRPDTTLHARSALIYKAGGFSAFANPGVSPEYDEERLWANEIGVDHIALGGRLTLGATVFWNQMEDYQFEKNVGLTGDYVVENAEEASAYGIELEGAYEILDGLQFDLAVGLINAEFDEHDALVTSPVGAVGTVDAEGNDLPFTPDYTVTSGLQYSFKNWVARGEWVAVGDTNYDDLETGTFEEDAYSLFNARVGYQDPGNWGIFLYGTNLTDVEYYTQLTALAVPAGVVGAPRQVGILLNIEF